MVIRLKVKKLVDDPYNEDIPLSHDKYSNKSIIGWFEFNGEMVAMGRLYINNKSAELGDVFVIESMRGKYHDGIKWSDRLMRSLISAAKRRNVEKIWLWVLENNHAAINLYEKHKFMIKSITKTRELNIREKYPWIDDTKIIGMIRYL